MGTRSLTVFAEDGVEIVVMYRQMDGYPTGHGKDLAQYLYGHRVINGISEGATLDNAFNGPGCMAAATVAHFKTDIGNIYLHPAGTRDCGEDYVYRVSTDRGAPYIEAFEVHGGYEGEPRKEVPLFEGTPFAFLKHVKDLEKAEAEESV